MGLRETLNRNPGLTTGMTVGIIVVAIGFVVWRLTASSDMGMANGLSANQAFYSDDDGATFFIDERGKVPPFDHNGKTAYSAMVYTCDGGKTKFVGYLRRFTPEAKKRREELLSKSKGQPTPLLVEIEDVSGIEVKKPGTGDKGWVKESDPLAESIRDVKCPNNPSETPELIPSP